MTDRELLELKRLRYLLDYDKDTGIFTWKVTNSNRAPVGTKAGCASGSNRYIEICIDGKLYKAHRLAWFYCHSTWPIQIDHINGQRTDNRLSNLRNATPRLNSENKRSAQSNNRSGFLGVSITSNGRFKADIKVKGKKIHLGYFDTAELAHSAYVSSKRILHMGSTL